MAGLPSSRQVALQILIILARLNYEAFHTTTEHIDLFLFLFYS